MENFKEKNLKQAIDKLVRRPTVFATLENQIKGMIGVNKES